MQENYLIHIEGTVITDDDKEVIDLTTTGTYYKRDGKYYICYNESEATGFKGSMTTVKVWDNGASINRYGTHRSNLVVEKGATNICNYETPAGTIVLEINGIEIDNRLTEKGGDVNLAYSLNASGLLISENTIKLNVKEI